MNARTDVVEFAKLIVHGIDIPLQRAILKHSLVSETVHILKPKHHASMLKLRPLSDALGFVSSEPRYGASAKTLARRVAFGGRKGRSAWRRLVRLGFTGTLILPGTHPMPTPPFTLTMRKGKPMAVHHEIEARRHEASCIHGDCWCRPGSDGS